MTVIAAGFDGGEPQVKRQGHRSNFIEAEDGAPAAAAAASSEGDTGAAWSGEPELPKAPSDPVFDDGDEGLDIPDFLK